MRSAGGGKAGDEVDKDLDGGDGPGRDAEGGEVGRVVADGEMGEDLVGYGALRRASEEGRNDFVGEGCERKSLVMRKGWSEEWLAHCPKRREKLAAGQEQ